MITQLPTKFIQQKVRELQSALFFIESDAVLKMPTHVITAAEVDDEGHIWFVIPKPTQDIESFEKDFHAKMDFFKKGKDFYIKITGIASIVANRAEIEAVAGISDEVKGKMEEKDMVAIRVKIEHADYFENLPKPVSSNWILTGTSHLYNLFFNSEYDYKNPQLVTILITVNTREGGY